MQEAGLLKEQGERSYELVDFNFEAGQSVLPQTELKKINQVVSTVKDLVKKNYKIVGITI